MQLIDDFRGRRVDSVWIEDFIGFCKKQWSDFDYKLSSGESLREVQIRNIEALKQILKEHDEKIHLCVRDNGEGAPEEDIPFLFDKGFTGSSPDRQKATGMGLYLVKKYAEALSIDVQIESRQVCPEGFGIELIFPRVETL